MCLKLCVGLILISFTSLVLMRDRIFSSAFVTQRFLHDIYLFSATEISVGQNVDFCSVGSDPLYSNKIFYFCFNTYVIVYKKYF